MRNVLPHALKTRNNCVAVLDLVAIGSLRDSLSRL